MNLISFIPKDMDTNKKPLDQMLQREWERNTQRSLSLKAGLGLNRSGGQGS